MKQFGGQLLLLVLVGWLLAPGRVAAQEERLLTMTILVRDSAGTPVAGLGVHVYTPGPADAGAVLLAEGLTDALGRVAFQVPASVYGDTPLYRTYSVALYAPAGSGLVIVPEDQQTLVGAGDMGAQVRGIGVVVGVDDFTLRLVVQEGQPYYDTADTDAAAPEPFIPGVSDAGPTPTPLVGNALPTSQPAPPALAPTGPPVLASTPGATAVSSPTGLPGTNTGATFPWALTLVILLLGGLGWYVSRRYAQGTLSLPAFLRRRRPQWTVDNRPSLPPPTEETAEEDADG